MTRHKTNTRTVALEEVVDDYSTLFAVHTISDQALPSVYDGFKPSHRMALWSGFHGNFHPDKPFSKTLKLVGHAVGHFYPYGDASLEGVLENLEAQHVRNIPFIEGSGSWSGCGIRPASPRYTSARLSKAGHAACVLVTEDAVDMVANYDGTETMPLLLPVTFPNVLCNPTSGIAVGLATKIPSFNLGELADVVKRMLKDKKKLTTSELRSLLPGPDFPMGSDVFFSDEELVSIYERGVGKVYQRAVFNVVTKNKIRFTSFPQDTNPDKLVSSVNQLLEERHPMFAGVRSGNKSDEGGAYLEVTLRRGVNPEDAAEVLYSKTGLQESFHASMNVLVGASPHTMGVLEMLERWIEFRFDVVQRTHKHRRDRAVGRLHIVCGLISVLLDIDEAIRIIRSADGRSSAQAKLMKSFKIDDVQADYVLARTLSSLTRSDTVAIEKERDSLQKRIEELDLILGSKTRQRNIIIAELDEATRTFGWARRSKIIDAAAVQKKTKRAKKMPSASSNAPSSKSVSGDSRMFVSPEGKGKRSTEMPGAYSCMAEEHATVVSSDSQALRFAISQVPEQGPKANGVAIMKLESDAAVVDLGTTNIEVTTNQGMGVIAASDIPVKGRGGKGVSLVALRKNETIVSFSFTTDDATMARGRSVPKH